MKISIVWNQKNSPKKSLLLATIKFPAVMAPLLYFVISCNPSYAPPPRGGGFIAPANYRNGELEISGSFTLADTKAPGRQILSGRIAYAPTDWSQVSLGGGLTPGRINKYGFWMVDLGARFSPYPLARQESWYKFLMDFELGISVGKGGIKCGNGWSKLDGDEDCWDGLYSGDRPAGGAYFGYGFGVGLRVIDLFVDYRFGLSSAKNIPNTTWIQFLIGMAIPINEKIKITGGVGEGYYLNTMSADIFYFGEVGSVLTFDLNEELK